MKHFSQLSETFFRKGRFCCSTKTLKKIAKTLKKPLRNKKFLTCDILHFFVAKLVPVVLNQTTNLLMRRRRIDSTEPIETDSSSEALETTLSLTMNCSSL